MIKRNYKNRVEIVNKEKATHYMTFNNYVGQRPLKPIWLEDLANKADNGLLGTGRICFAVGLEKSYLMDGQHILQTIIDKNLKLRCDIEDAHVDDDNDLTVLFRQFENRRRTQYDMIKAKHYGLNIKYPQLISNMIVSAAFMETQWGDNWNELRLQGTSLSVMKEKKTGNRLSMDDKIDLVEKYQEEALFLYKLLSNEKGTVNTKQCRHVLRSIVTFMILKTLKINKNDSQVFWKRVIWGENITQTKPEYKLREFLNSSVVKVKESTYLPKVTNHEIAYRIALAWNAFRKNSPTVLAYRINNIVPKLI